MKKIRNLGLIATGVLAMGSSCQKEVATPERICLKAKYVGEGCGTAVQIPIIQILDSINTQFEGAKWMQYNHTAGCVLPDKYKNGKSFYLTISKIDSNLVVPAICSAPKYWLVIDTFSDISCKSTSN